MISCIDISTSHSHHNRSLCGLNWITFHCFHTTCIQWPHLHTVVKNIDLIYLKRKKRKKNAWIPNWDNEPLFSFLDEPSWKTCARWGKGVGEAKSTTFCNWMGWCGISPFSSSHRWFTAHARTVSFFPPPYSPFLSPIEEFCPSWRWKFVTSSHMIRRPSWTQ